VISRVAITFLTIAMVQMPLTAHAAKKAKEVTEHLHTGQKVANFFRTFGIPDLGVLAIISALPVVELRGSIPVGIWMGYPITTVLPVCVLGNMAPIVPLLYLLRNKTLK
jgi:Putative small multi-drug export protein